MWLVIQGKERTVCKQYSAVLFDLDGTLLDTLADLADAANRALAALHLPTHPQESYRYFVGDGLRVLVERILPTEEQTEARIAELTKIFQYEYARNWNKQSQPYPGVPDMLDALQHSSLPMSVLSNKPDDFTRLCVEQLLPHWTFYPLFGQRPGVPKKPDPTAALAVAALLHRQPAEVLYVGDTAVDMATAKAAGMDAVGVLWGFRTGRELEQAGARYLIARPEHLVSILCAP